MNPHSSASGILKTVFGVHQLTLAKQLFVIVHASDCLWSLVIVWSHTVNGRRPKLKRGTRKLEFPPNIPRSALAGNLTYPLWNVTATEIPKAFNTWMNMNELHNIQFTSIYTKTHCTRVDVTHIDMVCSIMIPYDFLLVVVQSFFESQEDLAWARPEKKTSASPRKGLEKKAPEPPERKAAEKKPPDAWLENQLISLRILWKVGQSMAGI